MQWPLTIALLKFKVDFDFNNFFPSGIDALLVFGCIVVCYGYARKEGRKRRFPFVTEDFFEKLPLAGLITDFTTNTFFLTIYQKLIEMLVCSTPARLPHSNSGDGGDDGDDGCERR